MSGEHLTPEPAPVAVVVSTAGSRGAASSSCPAGPEDEKLEADVEEAEVETPEVAASSPAPVAYEASTEVAAAVPDRERGRWASPRDEGSFARQRSKSPEDMAEFVDKHAFSSVLIAHHWDCQKASQYHNLTPWVTSLYFIHSYFCYLYVFFMIVCSYFKSYALEHPEWRKWAEILLIISLQPMQYARFYFGYWGCQLGLPIDQAVFLGFCPVVMSVLMYFRFNQMYILPMEHTLLFIALWLVALEALCGVVNALQVMKILPCRMLHRVLLTLGIVGSLALICILALLEFSPRMISEEEYYRPSIYAPYPAHPKNVKVPV